MSLSPFLNRHAGETAWLFGKGPSLSTFDFSTAGPLRAAINDVTYHVPNCIYGFANDSARAWVDLYQKGQTIFQPTRALEEFNPRDCSQCDFVEYPNSYTERRGTLCAAIQILHFMGIKTIHLVGIDGRPVHAQGFQFRTRIQPYHKTTYDEIRNDAIILAGELAITLIFHKLDTTMTDGKITMRITRNCFVAGEPLEVGQVKAFAPLVARDLIACRGAEIVSELELQKPEKKEIETADTKPKAKEKATIR